MEYISTFLSRSKRSLPHASLRKYLLALWLLSLLALPHSSKAQSNASAQFAESYRLETAALYHDAINALAKVKGYDYHKAMRKGWLYYLAQDYQSSRKFYLEATRLRPKSLEAQQGLLYPLDLLGLTKEIVATYIRIVSIDRVNLKGNYFLGNYYYYLKDFAKAEQYFENVRQAYPFDYHSSLMSAWTKYFLGKKNEARSLFNTVLILSPSDQSALEGLRLLK